MIRYRMGANVCTLLSVLCLLAACQPSDRQAPDTLVYDTIGDTLVAHEQVASQWASPRRLRLDLVIGGVDAGSELTFGRVSNIAVEPSGRIVVEDTQGNSVIRFNADGVFSDSLGRRGEGPGEYRYPWGIAVLKDGRMAVRDNGLLVISLYDSNGTFIERWPLRRLIRESHGLEVDHDGFLMVRALFSESLPFTPLDEGFVILSPEGSVVDSIPRPATPWDGQELFGDFHPKKHFARYSSEFAVVGVSSGYHFDIRKPDQTIRVQQPYAPVPVSVEEKGAFDIEMAWRTRGGPVGLENIQPPPAHKAPYSRILVTRTGQIWVFRHGQGEQWTTMDLGGGLIWPRFREPLEIDVFDRDGRFLGVVQGDANIDPRVVSNDTVWAVVTGDFDEHYVARYLVR
jgi:hypothetical protein